MRYFTKDIWLSWQEDKPTRNWNGLWRRRNDAYLRQFRRLRGRLPPRAMAFFEKHPLHDARLITMGISDLEAECLLENGTTETRRRTKVPLTRVDITVRTMSTRPYRYDLRYTGFCRSRGDAGARRGFL